MKNKSNIYSKNTLTLIQKIHALQCSLQHYLQQPDMEATCVQHRCMVKEDAVYLHDEILLSHKNNEILSFGTT